MLRRAARSLGTLGVSASSRPPSWLGAAPPSRAFRASPRDEDAGKENDTSKKSTGAHQDASSDRVGQGMRGDGTAPRFYTHVGIERMSDGSGDWGVTLDGRALKTPRRVPLAVPSKSLALAIAAEWHWQSGRSVRPFTMPLMGLVATAIDQMSQPEVRLFHVRKLLEFFPSDVVLCRHEPGPVADRQAKAHARVLSWAKHELGKDLEPSTSIFGADLPESVVNNAEKRLNGMDAFELTATFNAAASAKSLLIGMALIRGAIDVEGAIRAARAEEDASIEEWGLVEGGHDVDQADITVRLAAPRAMMTMLRAG
jgi:ATP synthase F1 complex assembly factor 2